ncbi:hypothetical protein ADJ73_10565 [Arsenicicoccus sp. oral taxon 190]|nr:hypothetical protein ADJ73_10565 [Arsenicicoccus sp. oral taxon 190]
MPVLGWLVAAFVVSIVHRFVPGSRWMLVHFLLLGAVGNAIVTWTWHFTGALVRRPASATEGRHQVVRQILLNLGVLGVSAGVVGGTLRATVAGAVVVGSVLAWHGVALALRARNALSNRFRRTIGYYTAACLMLPVGATLGALMAAGRTDEWQSRLVLAHLTLNLLGFVGLTILGTLVTLWPTMLRTTLQEGSERTFAAVLPLLLGAILLGVGGALLGLTWVIAAGLVLYAAAVVDLAVPLARTARRKPPADFSTWSVAAGVLWLLAALAQLTWIVVTTPRVARIHDQLGLVVSAFAVGFVAQVLFGALSYLLPVMLGGGPAAVRETTRITQRFGGFRVAVTSLGLLVCLLPVPSLVRVTCSLLVLVGLCFTPPLLVRAVVVARRLRQHPERTRDLPGPAAGRPGAGPAAGAAARRRPLGGMVVGLAAVLLAIAGGVAADPAAVFRSDAAGGVTPTGRTVTVQVTAKGMRFTPDTATVDPGDRLVLQVTNADADVHDLTLETGQQSGRLAQGQSATVDVGVVGRSIEGWCSIVGHRQMGMVFHVRTTGSDQVVAAPGVAGAMAGGGHASHGGTAQPGAPVDLHGTFPADFQARDATLPPAPAGTLHRLTLRAQEVDLPVGPGVTRRRWTFNGQAPGPAIRGKVGDRFEITLVNEGTLGHSIDFHAGALAPDKPMRTLQPGQSLTYTFTATRSGIWMYHCSTMPMSVHIAAGMAGAVIIDPPGLPKVDKEYLVVQSELYLGAGSEPVDAAKIAARTPDAVVFNGVSGQYDARPLTARVGERVRFWVLDVGPDLSTTFHVVGGQFDRAFKEGAWLLRAAPGEPDAPGGSQALDLGAAQGGFVELTFPEAGRYPFVNHMMSLAESGAHGIVQVR